MWQWEPSPENVPTKIDEGESEIKVTGGKCSGY